MLFGYVFIILKREQDHDLLKNSLYVQILTTIKRNSSSMALNVTIWYKTRTKTLKIDGKNQKRQLQGYQFAVQWWPLVYLFIN